MEQLTKNVFVNTDIRGCHPSFVVTTAGVVMIDVPVDQDDARVWAKEIARWGNVRYIINTEAHFDHCMTNHLFDGVVIASQITSDLIREANNDRWLRHRTSQIYAHYLEVPAPEDYRKGWPSITFTDCMTLCLGECTFQIMLLPGHTPGQTSVYVPEEKVLFASDNMSKTPGAALHDALPDKWLESLEVYRKLGADFIVTGHEGVITSDHEKYLDLKATSIRERWDAVKQAKAEGLTVDEASERIAEMFPRGARPASQDFAPGVPGDIGPTRRWVAHLYHVTGANVTEGPREIMSKPRK